MQFDNSNFEKNVSTSMGTLNKLQDTINKTTSGNSFAEIGKAANSLNFSGLTATIQTVTEKFSILEQMAIGALRNIGAHIEQYLVNTLKSVTFDQIEAGFNRFSEMTESTQTILSAIATEDYGDIDKLEYTEDLLEKLAWFADETSYNFTDMTSNIAKFTAAGLDLDDSTTAMIGIANWAANAGQNATTASRAMYQLSQAMGMGSIKLMDWKSIETANMATKEVKELLLQYAAATSDSALKLDEAGYYYENITQSGVERIDIDSTNFRDSLRYGWLTADAFSNAMGEYASYSEALYKIIEKNEVNADGSTMIASDLISAFDEAIEKSKETGRAIEDIMMEDYKIDIMIDDGNGGLVSAIDGVTELGIRAMKSAQQARTWAQVIDSVTDAASTRWSFIFKHIFGNVNEATELFTNLANYFYDIFVEPINNLEGLFNKWNELGGRELLFEGEESVLANLENALSGLIDAVKGGFSQVFPPKTAEDLVNLTKRFRDFTATLVLTDAQTEKISNSIAKVLRILKTFGSIVSTAFKTVSRIFGQVKDTFLSVFTPNWLLPARKGFSDFFSSFTHALQGILNGIRLSDGAIAKLKDIFGGARSIINALGEAFEWLASKIKGIGDNTLDKIIGRFIGGDFLEFLLYIPSKIGKAATSIVNFVKTSEGLKKFVDTIVTVVKQTKEFMRGFFDAMFPEGVGKVISDIKDKIVSLFDSVKGSEKFNAAKEKIKGFFDTVKEFFEKNVTYEKGRETFEKLKDTLVKFGEKCSTAFDNAKTAISGFIDKVRDPLVTFGEKVGAAFNIAKDAIKGFVENSKAIQAIGDWFKNLFKPKDIEEGSENAETFGQKVLKVFGAIWEAIKWVAEKIKLLWEKIKELWVNLGVGEWLKNAFSGIGSFFKGIIDSIAEALAGITDADSRSEKLKKAFEFFKGVIGEILDIIVKILPGVAVGAGGVALGSGIGKLASFFSSPFKDLFSGISDFISGILDAVKGITGGKSPLEAFAGAISDIFKSLSIFVIALAAFVLIVSKIDNPDTIALAVGSIAALLGELSGIIILIMNFSDNSALKASKKLKAVSTVVTSMGIALILVSLAISTLVKAIDGKDYEVVAIAIGAIVALLGEMAGITALLMSMNTGDGGGKALNGVALTLIAMALAVKILAGIVKSLGEVDTQVLLKGTVAVAALVILVSLFTTIAEGSKGMTGAGIGLVLMAAAIAILANIAIKLGEVQTDALVQGVVAVGALIILVSLMAAIAGAQDGLLGAGIGMVLMAAAIAIMSGIVKDLGSMDLAAVEQGVLAVAAITVLLGILAVIAGHSKGLLKAGVALVAMAAAIAIIGGILIAIAAFAKSDGGTESLWNGIAALAVVILGLVGVAYLVGPAALPLLEFAAAVALLGVGLLAFALAAQAFIVTLTLLTTTTALSASAIGAALSAVLLGIVNAAPALIEALTALINAVLVSLSNSKQILLETILGFIVGFLELLIEYLPKILETLAVIIDDIIMFVIGRLGTLVDGLNDLLLKVYGYIKNIITMIIDDVQSGILTLIGYIDEDLNLIADNIYDFIMKVCDMIFGGGEYEGLIPRVLRGISESAQDFVDAALSVMESFKDGILDGIDIVCDGIEQVITSICEHIVSFTNTFMDAVIDVINGLADAIETHAHAFWNAVKRLAKAILHAFLAIFDGSDPDSEGGAGNLGQRLIEGIGEGIVRAWEWVKEKVRGIANAVLKFFGIEWEIKSPSRAMMRMGEYLMEGAAIGIEDGQGEAIDAATSAADSMTSAMSNAINDINGILSDDFQPTITPVMDLSQIQNGAYAMGNLLDSYDNYSIRAAVAANYNPYTYQDGTLKVDSKSQMAESIASLENKFDQMLYKLGQIRVVLDSGTLVGELVDPMDEALGRKAVYVGRGM